jgi:hypothetical protein
MRSSRSSHSNVDESLPNALGYRTVEITASCSEVLRNRNITAITSEARQQQSWTTLPTETL